MRKIISVLFMFAFLLGTQTAFASVSWNTNPIPSVDCPGSGIGNTSTDIGTPVAVNDCWMTTSVNGSQGDTIAVETYYHNTGDQPATNAQVKISVSPALGQSSTTHTFSSSITYNNGQTFNLGTTTLTLQNSQSLTLNYTKKYLNNGSFSTFGSEITSGGLSVGTINAEWTSQGATVTYFTVSSSNNNNYLCQDPTASNYGGPLPCVYYNQQTQCYVNISANPTYTTYANQPIYLNWNTNAQTINISGLTNGTGIYYGSGSATDYPSSSKTYSITAYGNNCYGTASDSVYVNVQNQNYNTIPTVTTYSPTYIGTNSATLNGYASNNTTYYPNYNNSSMNTWLEFPCYGTQYGNKYTTNSTNISATVYGLSPNTAYSYCAAAQNNNGQIYRGNVVTFTTTGQYVPPVNNNVSTTVATNITTNSATLNGLITNNAYSLMNTHFEYGTTVGLGSSTATKSVSGATNTLISDTISGLSSNTIYFFRAVGENSGNISNGKIEVFQTLKTGVKPIVVQGKTVVGTESPIMLKIENRYQGICNGDTVDYTITYKNVGDKILTKPMIQIVLPGGVNLTNSSKGTYDNTLRTLSVPLDDLNPQEEGVIFLQARVDSLELDTPQIITTALFIYTTSKNTQENAIAYLVNNPGNCNSVLGSSAFFAGFTPGGLFFWLLLIIVILLVVLIIRTYQRRYIVSKKEINQIS